MNYWSMIRRWSWEFPQSFLGLLLLFFYYKTIIKTFRYKDQKIFIFKKFPRGISLGYFSLIKYGPAVNTVIKHEYGHSIQSKWLGPFYLITVGLLSGIHNIICRIKKAKGISYKYYDFFIEANADKLGNVKR